MAFVTAQIPLGGRCPEVKIVDQFDVNEVSALATQYSVHNITWMISFVITRKIVGHLIFNSLFFREETNSLRKRDLIILKYCCCDNNDLMYSIIARKFYVDKTISYIIKISKYYKHNWQTELHVLWRYLFSDKATPVACYFALLIKRSFHNDSLT